MINVFFAKDSDHFHSLGGSWCQKFEMMTPYTLETKINRLRHSVETYYCAKFQVIPLRGFRFIMLIHTPTHIVTK